METLKNPFDKTILEFVFDTISCFSCGKNNPSEFHHIMGRGGRDAGYGYAHASPLNASPLCRECHSPEGRSQKKMKSLYHRDTRITLLRKTLNHLKQNGYQLTPTDHAFMYKYRRLYAQAEQLANLYPPRI